MLKNLILVYIILGTFKNSKTIFTKLSKLTFFSFRISYNFTEYCFFKKYKLNIIQTIWMIKNHNVLK